MRKPNACQSIGDFLRNATRSLYLTGNAYALALRNTRFEVAELHSFDSRSSSPMAVDDGSIFYRLAGNDVIERQLQNQQITVPARDVLHIRLHCNGQYPRPLVGGTPLSAALGDLATYERIKNQQDHFYENQARPSAVLSTDLNMSKDQVMHLRDRWNEQAKGLNAGGVPIFTHGGQM